MLDGNGYFAFKLYGYNLFLILYVIFYTTIIKYISMNTKINKIGVPSDDRTVYLEPSLKSIGKVIANNVIGFNSTDIDICGIKYSDLRDKARNEIIESALKYSEDIAAYLNIKFDIKQYIDKLLTLNTKYIMVTGHAPVFYHPGIWIKNIIVSILSKKFDGISLNVIMDNDILPDNVFTLPDLLNIENSGIQQIEWYPGTGQLPIEEINELNPNIRINNINDENKKRQSINNINVLDKTAYYTVIKNICQKILKKENFNGIEKYIEKIITTLNITKNVGEELTFSRIFHETDFNIQNLEIPISNISGTDSFILFFLSIALEPDRFCNIHNTALDNYRFNNKIRSKANPLPNLYIEGNVYEIPFWIWKVNSIREKIFIKLDKDSIHILNKDLKCYCTLSADNIKGSTDIIKKVIQSGYKIRPRAISNTIFLRLFLSDIFVHGIGGAKYDQITDKIIEEYYNIVPPEYMTATATLFPPISKYDISKESVKAAENDLKKVHFNPDKFIPRDLKANPDVKQLLCEKELLIERCNDKDKRGTKEDFVRLKQINYDLCQYLKEVIETKEKEIRELKVKLKYNEVVNNRNFPIYIFPNEFLREFYDNNIK